MSSLAPLTRSCPECRAALAAEATYCVCGYQFGTLTQESSSADLVVQAEVLYESHLRARLQRAVRAAKLAHLDLLRDPRSAVKTEQLREAEREVKLLEAKIDIQCLRIAEARAAATRTEPQTVTAASPDTETPNTFRATQTLKAEQTFELLRLEQAMEKRRSVQTTALFHATQADKAREIVNSTDAMQACPSCGGATTIGATRCGCGYVLSDSATAADFLTNEELAALRGAG